MYTSVIDALPEAVLIAEPGGAVQSLNRRAGVLLGYEPEELQGQPVARVLENLVLTGGDPSTATTQILTAIGRDGSRIPVEVRTARFASPDSAGAANLLLLTLHEGNATMERLSAVFEHSHDGIYVVDATEGRILDANPRACELLGYQRSEMVGAPVTRIHPGEESEVRLFLEEAVKKGQAKTSELNCECNDGRKLDVEISASRARYGDRQVVIAMVRDVSEQRQLEQNLNRLASLPKDNPNPVVELDISGKVTYINPVAQATFPHLAKLGEFHPFSSGVTSLVRRMQEEKRRTVEREVEVGGDTYGQKISVDAEMDLVRIYAYDLTARKQSEELRRQLEIAETTKSATLDTILRLAHAAEYRDEDTGAHIHRMASYSAAIARHLGLDGAHVELILYGSPMHDIGKIGIPDRILLKPGRLTEEEMAVMRKHTFYGAAILANSSSQLMNTAETIALTHHEKWDGSGYPRGVRGADIAIEGRIVAVADVYDALTSKRPYKDAMAPDRALEIMRSERGAHFDAEVLDAFLDIQPEIADIGEHHSGDELDLLQALRNSPRD
jgi:PAS domain S-box-containing protein